MASIREQIQRHANRCTILIGGVAVAEGTSLSIQESGGAAAVRVIGTPRPVEHVHNAYTCSFTIGRLVWTRGAIKNFDLSSNLLNIPEFAIEGFEGPPGEVAPLFTLERCTITSRSNQISANQPISSNLSGEGISILSDDADYSDTPISQS